MPIQNSIPLKWSPKGLTDAGDGTNSFPGAMDQLANLIPDPSTAGVYVCRPAAIRRTNFTGAHAPTGPGILSAILTVGDLEYGMVASTLNAGKDEPYCYDLANNAFLPVAGITNANTPTSPPSTGDWVPPIMAQISPRVIVCHPGFPGGLVKFGWFDVSGFSEVTLGNTHTSTKVDCSPSILGVQPGMTISGAGIPAGTSIVATAEFALATSGLLTGAVLTHLGDVTGVAVGQVASGLGIPVVTVVTAITQTPFVTNGNTHSSIQIDGFDPALGIPSFGDAISGAGIPANARVVAVAAPTAPAVGDLNGTTTIHTGVTSFALVAGQFVTGFGIVPGSKIVTPTPFSLTTTGDLTAGSPVISGMATTIGIFPGQQILGFGIDGAEGSVVVSVDGPGQITMDRVAVATAAGAAITFNGYTVVLDNAATVTASLVLVVFAQLTVTMDQDASATASGVPITFTASSITLQNASLLPGPQNIQVTFTGTTITLSQAAVASANSVSLTIAGGTRAAPLWGAGDCDRNPLLSTPLGVAQMNGRAWFADGLDGIPFSDSGLPCRRSNQPNVQALTTNDGLSVTAIGALVLGQPITGGVVQALVAFEGEAKMQQITGDPETGNLAMSALQVATGTLAPLSIVPCGGQLGTAFISPQGLRFVRLDGSVTDPVGADGQGITDPFQFAVAPSQICGAANAAVLRYTVQNGRFSPAPYQDYWFDLSRKTWSGPHTFPARLVQPWRSSFIVAPIGVPASLWQSDAYQNPASIFVENGQQMSWVSKTVLLPDNAQMAMNAMVEANLTLAGVTGDIFGVTTFDENGNALGTVILIVGANQALRERSLDWPWPIVFKQMSIGVTGSSDAGTRVGNLYMRYEILGYNNDVEEASGDILVLADNTATIILTDDPSIIWLTPT